MGLPLFCSAAPLPGSNATRQAATSSWGTNIPSCGSVIILPSFFPCFLPSFLSFSSFFFPSLYLYLSLSHGLSLFPPIFLPLSPFCLFFSSSFFTAIQELGLKRKSTSVLPPATSQTIKNLFPLPHNLFFCFALLLSAGLLD